MKTTEKKQQSGRHWRKKVKKTQKQSIFTGPLLDGEQKGLKLLFKYLRNAVCFSLLLSQ